MRDIRGVDQPTPPHGIGEPCRLADSGLEHLFWRFPKVIAPSMHLCLLCARHVAGEVPRSLATPSGGDTAFRRSDAPSGARCWWRACDCSESLDPHPPSRAWTVLYQFPSYLLSAALNGSGSVLFPTLRHSNHRASHKYTLAT